MYTTLFITYFSINLFGFPKERVETVPYKSLTQCENSLEIKYHKYDQDPQFKVDYDRKRLYMRVVNKDKREAASFKCVQDEKK